MECYIFYRLVCEKFSELTSGNPTLAKRKVLAGIVMTNENDLEDMKVCIEYLLYLFIILRMQYDT